jgi:hypothetical protein
MAQAIDLLQSAALTLVRPGSVKDRLVAAYREHLSAVDSHELPNELHEQFDTLTRQLCRERPLYRGEDAVHATVRKMSNEEATEVAAAIVRMFGVACSQSGTLRGFNGASVVRLYAAEH